MPCCGFLGGQERKQIIPAGPSFSPSPDHIKATQCSTTAPQTHIPLPPRLTTSPLEPPTHPHIDTQDPNTSTLEESPVNISKYRLGLFDKARETTKNFLGKFSFIRNSFPIFFPPFRSLERKGNSKT